MKHAIEETISAALREDIGHGDITTNALVPEDAQCMARLTAKQAGVLSGIGVFEAAFTLAGANVSNWESREDGDAFAPDDTLATFTGRTRAVLAAERTALNFVQQLSGIATLTRKFAEEVAGFGCQVCDTRKTTPLLRQLEKEAVRHGGGANHRFNLTDGILIKDNHIAAAGGIAEAIARARSHVHHLVRIEVEVTSLEELKEALDARADVIMLDNMDCETMATAVTLCDNRTAGKIILEASGNVTLAGVRAIAETGVDFISVGALTHSAAAVDLSLSIKPS